MTYQFNKHVCWELEMSSMVIMFIDQKDLIITISDILRWWIFNDYIRNSCSNLLSVLCQYRCWL